MSSSNASGTSTPEENNVFHDAGDTMEGVTHEHNGDENAAPQPPSHKTPSGPPPKTEEELAELRKQAEVSKESGNKFFKAKQYAKAIDEYTKGWSLIARIPNCAG